MDSRQGREPGDDRPSKDALFGSRRTDVCAPDVAEPTVGLTDAET